MSMSFTDQEIQFALRVAPSLKGVFEREYKPPYTAQGYFDISAVELAAVQHEVIESVRLRRLQVAEAAIEIGEYLREQWRNKDLSCESLIWVVSQFEFSDVFGQVECRKLARSFDLWKIKVEVE